MEAEKMNMPSFGSFLRGCRLGYRWSDKYQCFIRCSDAGDLFCIEVAPDRGIPAKVAGKAYRIWWDKPELLDLCPALKEIGPVKKYQRLYVNDAGERIK